MEELHELQRKFEELSAAYDMLLKQVSRHDSKPGNNLVMPATESMDIGRDSSKYNDEAVIFMKVVAFLNAKHYMVFAGKKGTTHGHSWQLQAEAEVRIEDNSFVKFEDVDKHINTLLAPYQKTVLNDIPPFTNVEPLTENITVHFFNCLYDDLRDINVHLVKLTLWENPTKGIEITNKMENFFSSDDSIPVPNHLSVVAGKYLSEAAAVAEDGDDHDGEMEYSSLTHPQGEDGTEDGSGANYEADAYDEADKLFAEDGLSNCLELCEIVSEEGMSRGLTTIPANDNSKKQPANVILSLGRMIIGLRDWLQKIGDVNSPNDSNLSHPTFRLYPWWQILIGIAAIIGVSVIAYWPLLTAPSYHAYPWGADTWGHLYKADYLYNQMLKGNFFPQFIPDWYNGSELFRYWAPLPYYFIAIIRCCVPNIFVAGNYYIFICAIIGGLFWLMARKDIGLWPAIMAGVVWVIWPDNLKIALAEGNLPRVLTTAILPLAFWVFFKTINPQTKNRLWPTLITILSINMLVLCHAMMSAIYCVSFMLFAILLWIFKGTSMKLVLRGFFSIIAGLTVSSWWLMPSLRGGLTGMSKEAASAPVEFIKATLAFDPTYRFIDPGAHYWGISLVLIIGLTLLIWRAKPGWAKSLFYCGLLLIMLTLPSFSWLQQILPLGYILWPLRFSTFASFALIACGFSFTPSYLLSSRSNQVTAGILVLAIFLGLSVDSYFSHKGMVNARTEPYDTLQCSSRLSQSHGWRVATLDFSSLASAPSYLFSMRAHREQVFGWAWQGATTSQNIMLLNTALTYNWYPFLFRELNHLGGTDLVVNDKFVGQLATFKQMADRYGYSKQEKIANISIWKKQSRPYMVVRKKSCLVIGKHASIYALLFPDVEIGHTNLIDEYSPEELKGYKLIILSGAQWRIQSEAERRILDYTHSGGRLIVDFTGFPLNVLARQPKFLGIYAEPVDIRHQLTVESDRGPIRFKPFSLDYPSWRTYAPQSLDKTLVSYQHYGNKAAIWGYKNIDGNKIWFLGGNLAYHVFLTGDTNALQVLEQFTGLSNEYTPEKTVAFDTYKVKDDGYSMSYSLDTAQDVVIPISDLEGFEAKIDGKVAKTGRNENMISLPLPAGNHQIDLRFCKPPVCYQGIYISLQGLLGCFVWLWIEWRRAKSKATENLVVAMAPSN